MKSNTFNYSLLAVGVAALMGVSTGVIAATSGTVGDTTTEVTIANVASANYSVGDVPQPKVESNEVIIKVSEQVSFSLVSNNEDGSAGNDSNVNEEVAPNGFALFEHTLTNTGNREDEYTVSLENVTGDDSQYDLDNSTFSYQIYDANNETATGQDSSGSDLNVNTFNNVNFTLEAGQYVDFTINAKTKGNKGGNAQDLLLSATSTELTGNTQSGVTNTLTNTDSSITKLPSFSIVKTMKNGLDLNDTADTATYEVKVKNIASGYSTAATDVTIEDFLPAGLVLATGLTTSDIIASGSATKGTIASSNAGDDGFSITGIDIPVGETITITFDVIQGGTGTLDPATALNHVDVTDDLDDNVDTDNTLVDSTKTANEQNVGDFYPETEINYTDGTQADIDDINDSTQPLLTISRDVSLTEVSKGEIPRTSDSQDGAITANRVTHETVITNNGQDVEGDTAGELTFTITDDAGNPQVNFDPNSVTITYDIDGDLTTTGDQTTVDIAPTTTNGNTYDINSALPNGIASGGKAVINYEVKSENAVIGTENSTTITLDSAGEGASTQQTVTDTTFVRGIELDKTQSLDADCDGTSDNGTFNDNDIDAEPGQCVVYQIEAKNTSGAQTDVPGFNITGLKIFDLLSNFSANADVDKIQPTTTSGAPNTITVPAFEAADRITTTVTPLAPQDTATMQFTIKIKTNR
jgi:hypothetical protein